MAVRVDPLLLRSAICNFSLIIALIPPVNVVSSKRGEVKRQNKDVLGGDKIALEHGFQWFEVNVYGGSDVKFTLFV